MMKKYRIAAYITAYEDPEAVNRCIAAIQRQSYTVEKIFIVDNSRVKILSPEVHENNIVIQFHPENIGIASGLRIGVNWAIEQGYDFLWTFDQDSEPFNDSLEKLLARYSKLTDQGLSIGIIAPLPIDFETGLNLHGDIFNNYKLAPAPGRESNEDFYECDVVITSGSLVALEVAKNVELPDENLFIDAVDWAYCMNFRSHDYKIIVLKNAILKHCFGTPYQVKSIFKRKDIKIHRYSPLRYYYICRNQTFVETRLARETKQAHKAIAHRLIVSLRVLAKILVYESDLTLLKAWACIRGTSDGLFGKLGKSW